MSRWAINGHSNPYSINSSARASTVSGMMIPSALAALRLITRSSWHYFACSASFFSFLQKYF